MQNLLEYSSLVAYQTRVLLSLKTKNDQPRETETYLLKPVEHKCMGKQPTNQLTATSQKNYVEQAPESVKRSDIFLKEGSMEALVKKKVHWGQFSLQYKAKP